MVNHIGCYILTEDTKLLLSGSKDYYYVCNELIGFSDVLVGMGVKNNVKVNYRKPNSLGHVVLKKLWGDHERGLDGFDPKADVDGLRYAILSIKSNHDIDRARFIWNRILIPHKHLIKGQIEHASRQSYDNSTIRQSTSVMANKVMDIAWIPSVDGNYYKPGELALSDLPDGFKLDKDLAEALGMKILDYDPVDELADRLKFPRDLMRKVIERSDLLSDLLENLRSFFEKAERTNPNYGDSSNAKPEFPNHSVFNSQRRTESVAENIHQAPDKSYEKRERSVRVSDSAINKEAYLKNYYTNANDEMVCQLCKKVMPFKKKNGDYYFESVELLTKEQICKESESLYLALCPTCAAKYKEYIKFDNSKIRTIVKQIQSNDIGEITIETDRTETLKFNPPHYLDIRTILTELLDPE